MIKIESTQSKGTFLKRYMTFSFVIFVFVLFLILFVCFFSFLFKMCTVGLYVSLCLMIFLCPFLYCKALRTAMYKRYINSIIIIIIIKVPDNLRSKKLSSTLIWFVSDSSLTPFERRTWLVSRKI